MKKMQPNMLAINQPQSIIMTSINMHLKWSLCKQNAINEMSWLRRTINERSVCSNLPSDETYEDHAWMMLDDA
jgi:hypothetical protein